MRNPRNKEVVLTLIALEELIHKFENGLDAIKTMVHNLKWDILEGEKAILMKDGSVEKKHEK